ncbi:MAG: tetratricopeptide repeat protein [Actinobacteria bacterium]|nr:tetratricopeptide repeat protein [Actinomycetota bacterium]
MGQVVWLTLMGRRVLAVTLVGDEDVDVASDADPTGFGPVEVRRIVAGVVEVLGVAATVADAFGTWDELRELGDAVHCTCISDPEWVIGHLYDRFRPAPPEGWDGPPHTFGGCEINGEWFDLNLQDLSWEEVASLGGELGGFTLSYLDGWFQLSSTDMDDEYRWAGTAPDFEAEGWSLVMGPPMWPSGNALDVRLSFVEDPTAPEVVDEFVQPSITEMYQYIELNGVEIYRREIDAEPQHPPEVHRPRADPPTLRSSSPGLPDLVSATPDSSNDSVDSLRRDLGDAITRGAPAEEVEQIRAFLGDELLQAGRAEEAIGYFEQAVHSATERSGPDDEDVLNLRGLLGRALTEAALYHEAEQVLLDVVDARTRVLGPDDPQTLVARGNLLRAIGRGGRPAEALSMADALLEDRIRLLGPEHPSTLDTRGHRAQLLSEAGRDAEAIAEMERLLEDRIRVLGPDHPDVASTRHNLAAVRSRGEGSDPDSSWWELQQNAVAISDELGPDHPAALIAWGLVAEQLQRLGRDAEALALLGRLVEARSRILGEDAAQTLTSRRMMCASQRRLGAVREALAGAEELEATAIESLGPDSPLVQQIRSEQIACLRQILAEADVPDPVLTARRHALIELVIHSDLDPDEFDAHLAMLLDEPQPLESPEQLPDVPGATVLVDWVKEPGGVIVLSCDGMEIWREQSFTNARRLSAVFEICRARYGPRFAGVRLDAEADEAIRGETGGSEIIDFLESTLGSTPTRPPVQFPITRSPPVRSVPSGGRRPWGAISDNYFLTLSAFPSGVIEVDFLDTSDDVDTDFSQRFEVDGSVLLPVLLEREFGRDPDDSAVARRGAELGYDPSVWQDVAVTLYAAQSGGEVVTAREIAEAAGALVDSRTD